MVTKTFEFDDEILWNNIENQGFNAVNNKTVEELAELIQAIQKYRQCMSECPDVEIFHKHYVNMIEEMADVYIVLENTKLVFNVMDETIQKFIKDKQERQAKRIAGELPYVD